MSDVVNTRLVAVVLFVVLDGAAIKERVVSGPESMNGDDTFKVSVYGGPYEPLLIVESLVRAHEIRVGFVEGVCAFCSLRSRF